MTDEFCLLRILKSVFHSLGKELGANTFDQLAVLSTDNLSSEAKGA